MGKIKGKREKGFGVWPLKGNVGPSERIEILLDLEDQGGGSEAEKKESEDG